MHTNENTLLESALSFVRKGIPVLPLHTQHDGICSCNNPGCTYIAKHPRYARGLIEHAYKDASTDEGNKKDLAPRLSFSGATYW